MKPLDPRLLRHASAARRYVVLAAGLAVATAGLVLGSAELLARAVEGAFLGGTGIDAAVPLLLGLLAAVTARAVLAWAGEVAAHRASTDVVRQLRARLVGHALELGPRHPGLPPGGELATLATRGLDGLDGYFGRYLPTLLVAAVVPAAVAGRILFADPLSGLIVGLTVPLIPIFMILVGLHTERSTRRQWRTLAVLGHHFLDLVAGMDVLVAFGRARHQSGRLRDLAESYRRATLRTLRVAFLSALVLELLATLSVALVAVAIGLRLVDGRLDLRTALVVLVLVPEVYLPLRAVGARFHDSAEGLAAAAEVFAVLETPVSGSGERRPAPDPSRVPVRLDGVVVEGRGGRVLDGLDLLVEPGTVLGVSGPSGSGKSTLVDLLLGLRRPDRGRVTVGGVDLADVDPVAWSRRVAWVPQRPVLVAGTVADNIRLGVPDAPGPAVAAAAAAAALDLALDTAVGEDGTGLSTGQQRRVALARALLADRPLLLLDEPTEGVDADTEAAITAALPAIAAGRTVVLVSHRPDLLAVCDRVHTVDGPGHARRRVPVPAPLPPPIPAAAPTAPAGPRPGPAPTPVRGALRWSLSAARAERGRLALAAALGALALGCGVALTATSAWLISTAALHPPVLTLLVAIVAVRAFGLGKGVLRYAERLVSHDAALRASSALRVRIWAALVRLGPAATARLRRGELLSRLIADVDAQQDLLVRALLPAAAAAAVGLGTAGGIGLLLPAAGAVVAVGLLVAGVLAPAATAWAAHRTERRTAAARGEVLARTVEIVEAAPDLIAFGAAPRFRDRLADTDTRLAVLLRRAATARGVGAGLAVLAIGATSVAATAVGIAAVRAGTLPGPALAVLALTPLALADVVAGLPDAAVRLLTALPAARRLAELESRPPRRHRSHGRARRCGSVGVHRRRPRRPLARGRRRRRRRRRPGPAARHAAGADRAVRVGQVQRGRRPAAHPGPERGHAARRRSRRARADRGPGPRRHRLVRRPDPPVRQHAARQPRRRLPRRLRRPDPRRARPGPARRLARRAARRAGHRGRRARRHGVRR
ncbi:thiol reductant ABC exporter subunit CydD [Pseudonocardia petroleophila]